MTMDYTLLTFFNQTLAHPLLDILMVGLTFSLSLLPGLGVVLVIAKQRRIGLAILATLTVGWLFTMIFQFLAVRPRPEGVRLVLAMPGFPSFPSGHAVAAWSTAVILALSYRRACWQGGAVATAALISLSRVYLGHHYPSDILGGAALGAALGAAGYGLIVAEPSHSRWRWLLWPQMAIALVATQMAYLDILPTYLLDWPMADKVLHFVLFGAVTFWLNLWLEGRGVQVKRWSIPVAILIPLMFALSEEALQFFSPARTTSVKDLLSDLAGMSFFWWVSRRMVNNNSTPYPTPE